MLEYNRKKDDNISAILVGLFLIVAIMTITFLRSYFGKEPTIEVKNNQTRKENYDFLKNKKITSEELLKKILENSDLTIVDIRSKEEYTKEHIIDSINIPLPEISSTINTPEKNKTYIFIDDSGEETIIGAVVNILSDKKYENIYYLEGGFNGWKNKFNQTISDGDPNSFVDQSKVKYISSEDLKNLMEKEKRLVIIDVRKNSEFSVEHLPTSINIFLDNLESDRKKIPSRKTIVLYDANGVGAFKGSVRLFDLGIPQVFALSDGLDGWKKKNYETIK